MKAISEQQCKDKQSFDVEVLEDVGVTSAEDVTVGTRFDDVVARRILSLGRLK